MFNYLNADELSVLNQISSIAELDCRICTILSIFHALMIGCDTFLDLKEEAWNMWMVFPLVTAAFKHLLLIKMTLVMQLWHRMIHGLTL